ncbi:MAG: M28 family peptidase [candidate division KSB1 bacterium]|nr:M28 family peptidase [candidate division KSB1 bacterium]MDZ7274997.1 M28 family peptidase [candidate division KSB1 bacterium]MDZ7286553.1 M28 family peptidase [candidate division KSB1 bacterium]MDZ7299283.1 M28 family peptidase [candidate division KSB1 bacterium]MDZ7307378.1 M28 family peptidase [candidate division KSB1 bacterium]
MRRHCLWVLALSFGLAACGRQAVSESEAANLISKDEILADTRALSADDMEGRAPGTPGGEKAAAYLATRFKQVGLAPVNGSYFQSVRLVGMKKDAARSTLSLSHPTGELDYISDSTLTYWSSAQKPVVDLHQAPLLFVGYGVEAPEHDWDDFKGAPVAGKVLLFLNNDPPVTENGMALFQGETRTYYGRWTYKFEQAMKHGAAGAFMIHTTESASYGFNVVQHSGAEEHFALDLPNSGHQVDLLGWLDQATAERIAQLMGTTLAGLFAQAASRAFKPVDTGVRVSAHLETTIRKVETKNVIGMLEGSDPQLKEQVIVFSAHYDHLGRNDDLPGVDKIYNGAWDNAVGTAGLIHLGRAFAALSPRPRRSLLMLACAAEESGLLGSQWFTANPPFALARFVANFNVDMPQIFGLTSDIAAIGLDMSTLGEALRTAASQYTVVDSTGQSQPLTVRGDPDPNAGSFYRSDQVNFAKAGIPALYLNPGKQYLRPPAVDPRAYHDAHYHRVEDEVNDLWDLSGCERDVRVFFAAALKVANAAEQPRWVPGSEFEEEWKALYGR